MAPSSEGYEDTDRPPALVRPFLALHTAGTGGHDAGLDPYGAQGPDTSGAGRWREPVVRAYLLTGGRTESEEIRLEYESMLTVSPRGRGLMASLAFERRQILELCAGTAQSVAEVAARLHIPIGVARVLAADLVSEGLLHLHQSSIRLSDDIAMITRLIQGVRNL